MTETRLAFNECMTQGVTTTTLPCRVVLDLLKLPCPPAYFFRFHFFIIGVGCKVLVTSQGAADKNMVYRGI